MRWLPLILLTALLAAACTASPHAHGHVGIHAVSHAPPPPRAEVVVAKPGPDRVWVPGHWDWKPQRDAYAWVEGRWVRPPRRGAVWVAPRVERRSGNRVYIAGHWRF